MGLLDSPLLGPLRSSTAPAELPMYLDQTTGQVYAKKPIFVPKWVFYLIVFIMASILAVLLYFTIMAGLQQEKEQRAMDEFLRAANEERWGTPTSNTERDIANIWKDDSLEDISNGDTTHFPNEWKDESDEWSDEKQAAREARLAYKGQHDNDFGDLDYHDDHHGSAPDRPVDPAEFSRDWRTEASRIGRFHDDPRFDEDIEMVELDEWSAPKNILKSVIQEMNPLLGDSTADLTREIENVHDINSLSKTISDLKWRVYETQSKNMGNSLLDRASYHTEFEDGFLTQCGFPSGWGKKVNERLERCVRFLQHPPVAKKDATAEEADGLMKFISQFIPNYAA